MIFKSQSISLVAYSRQRVSSRQNVNRQIRLTSVYHSVAYSSNPCHSTLLPISLQPHGCQDQDVGIHHLRCIPTITHSAEAFYC